MKHIAVRSTSVRKRNRPYTTPGLGDRVHTVLIGLLYSLTHNVPVTLHLTSDKWDKQKPESFNEILSLIPPGLVYIQPHYVSNLPETEWLSYLSCKGFDAVPYCYKDYLGKFEDLEDLDISKYFSKYPCIPPLDTNIKLPSKFITVQWDSTDEARRLSNTEIKNIESKYIDEGYDIVIIGGNAQTENLKFSLKDIGNAMSNADIHVGVDSGFMHFAQLYKLPEQIHMYNKDSDKNNWSHHLKRAVDNGIVFNKYFNKE